MKCLPTSNKFLLLLNSLKNSPRIYLPHIFWIEFLIKKETCTIKLPHILFLIEIDFLSVAHQQQMHNTHQIFITPLGFFFWWFKDIVIPNYNWSKLLKFNQKIEEPLGRRVSACLEASLYILREFRKLVITFFTLKNTLKLINQQFKKG